MDARERYMELIVNAGYKAFVEDGIVYAVVPDCVYTNMPATDVYKRLLAFREQSGYDRSWGVIPERSEKFHLRKVNFCR